MKHILLFVLIGAVAITGNLQAQGTRRVLVEEFTSSTCPPCAATDPYVQKFTKEYADNIVVLKWHVNWPSPGNDPMYNAFKGSVNRSTVYYGNIYAPFVFVGGNDSVDITSQSDIVGALESSVDDAATTPSPFEITINSQEIVGDSIIVMLTVKSSGTLPSENDLRLGVVIGERFIVYTGTNGAPSHDYVVRTTIPSLVSSTGALGATVQYPAFSILEGGTNTYRYAAKIGTTWNRSQLFTAAFIQSIGSKEVFQSAWNLLNVSVERVGSGALTVGDGSTALYRITNHSSTDLNLKLVVNAPASRSSWGLNVTDVPNGVISVAKGQSKEFNVGSANGISDTGLAGYTVIVQTADGVGQAGAAGYALGSAVKDVIVNPYSTSSTPPPSVTATKMNTIVNNLKAIGYDPYVIDGALFSEAFPDWGHFRTILYIANDYTAQFDYKYWPNNFDALSSYLDNGGHFLMCSDGLDGYYFSAYSQTNNDAYIQGMRDCFHIEPEAFLNPADYTEIHGISGDPIGNNINSTVSGVQLTQPLTPYDVDGIPCIKNENDQTIGMHSIVGNGKSAFQHSGIRSLEFT